MQVPFTIPAELSNNLGHVSAQLQADLHDVLLAAFSVLLVRYSRQDDITLGCALPCGNHQVCPWSWMTLFNDPACFVSGLKLAQSVPTS